MSSYVIDLPSCPVNVACSNTEDALAVLLADGTVQVWDLNTKIPDPKSGSKLRGGGKVADPIMRSTTQLKVDGKAIPKQIGMGQEEFAALFWTEGSGAVVVVARQSGDVDYIPVDGGAERLLWAGESGWLVLDRDGVLKSGEFASLRGLVAFLSIS